MCAEDKDDVVSLTIKRGGLVHHNTQEPTDTHTYVCTYMCWINKIHKNYCARNVLVMCWCASGVLVVCWCARGVLVC